MSIPIPLAIDIIRLSSSHRAAFQHCKFHIVVWPALAGLSMLLDPLWGTARFQHHLIYQAIFGFPFPCFRPFTSAPAIRLHSHISRLCAGLPGSLRLLHYGISSPPLYAIAFRASRRLPLSPFASRAIGSATGFFVGFIVNAILLRRVSFRFLPGVCHFFLVLLFCYSAAPAPGRAPGIGIAPHFNSLIYLLFEFYLFPLYSILFSLIINSADIRRRAWSLRAQQPIARPGIANARPLSIIIIRRRFAGI